MESIQKTLGLASTMKWNGKNPEEVVLVKEEYLIGVKLTSAEMDEYEKLLLRKAGS